MGRDPQPCCRLDFILEQNADLREAKTHYLDADLVLAEDFAIKVQNAFDNIAEHPERWPKYLNETRVIRLQRFPYMVIYKVLPDRVRVIAISHMKRDAGYWAKRTGTPNDPE